MRVVIADDETLLREGVARLLDEAGFQVVGKAATAEELLRRVELTRPDVALVDIKMLALMRTTFTTRTLAGIVIVVILSAFAIGTAVNLLA